MSYKTAQVPTTSHTNPLLTQSVKIFSRACTLSVNHITVNVPKIYQDGMILFAYFAEKPFLEIVYGLSPQWGGVANQKESQVSI